MFGRWKLDSRQWRFAGSAEPTISCSGGAGQDTFVFRGGYGSDQVGDFDTTQDKIELQNSLAVSFSDAMTFHAAQVGADVQFTFGSEVLTLSNVQLANLNASNFLFVS